MDNLAESVDNRWASRPELVDNDEAATGPVGPQGPEVPPVRIDELTDDRRLGVPHPHLVAGGSPAYGRSTARRSRPRGSLGPLTEEELWRAHGG